MRCKFTALTGFTLLVPPDTLLSGVNVVDEVSTLPLVRPLVTRESPMACDCFALRYMPVPIVVATHHAT